jgi:hypothetical protein
MENKTLLNDENSFRVQKALKAPKETQWVGEITFSRLDEALRSIILHTLNSGLSELNHTRVPGVKGVFLLNNDNSIFWEARAIKTCKDEFKIEWLSDSGYAAFENAYNAI